MANALRKSLVYFGLADDGEAELAKYEEQQPEPEVSYPMPVPEYTAEVTPIRPVAPFPVPSPAKASELRRITTIHPRSYNDARLIGESFRDGTPVIINLSDMSDDDAKRLVDFSSGLIFGLHGGIERVTAKVFLLSPEHIEVIGEDEVSAQESIGGQFYNQS